MKKLMIFLFALVMFGCKKDNDTIDSKSDNAKIKTETIEYYSAVTSSGVLIKKAMTGKIVYGYNIDGDYKNITLYFSNGKIEQNEVFTKIDSNTLKSVTTGDTGTIYGTAKYVKDSKGNIIELYSYDTDGTLESYSEYKYDSLNRFEKQTFHDYQSGYERTSWTYYEYAWDGKTMTETGYYMDETKIFYTVEYTHTKFDSKHNWINRTAKYTDPTGISLGIDERTLEYY